MVKCTVKLKHVIRRLEVMDTFPQISFLWSYNVLLLILWLHVGLSLKDGININKTVEQPLAPTTLPIRDNLSASSNDSSISSHQANNLLSKHQTGDESASEPKNTSKERNIPKTHDNATNNVNATAQADHSTSSAPLLVSTVMSVTPPSLVNSSSSSVINASSEMPGNHSTSIPLTSVPRKSKPEETNVDDFGWDSGPSTDYVVPLVVAMLAVPLVGVLCALLYLKGKDFWERRHYGRIDFLWDNRSDSRVDFLIDGMYNN